MVGCDNAALRLVVAGCSELPRESVSRSVSALSGSRESGVNGEACCRRSCPYGRSAFDGRARVRRALEATDRREVCL
jgi:hypothetical protein